MIEETNLENSRFANIENWWFYWFENSEFFVSNLFFPITKLYLPLVKSL